MKERINGILERLPLVAILRGVPSGNLLPLAQAIARGGVRLLEVTLTDDDALQKIETLRAHLPSDIAVGAGTVTSAELAADAHAAGAEYFVTPHLEPSVNAYARKHAVGLISGALSPTEIAAARAQGSEYVKLFPASTHGPEYVKALLGPYPDLKLLAVGGVDRHNLPSFLRAGAVGAGVGSSLTRLDWTSPDYAAAESEARELVELIHPSQVRDPRVRTSVDDPEWDSR